MMMRSLPGGKLHQGLVSLERRDDVSSAMMAYMLESEQVKSMIDVACVVKGRKVVAAGGYVVQLLPDLTDTQLAIMAERVTVFPPMSKVLSQGGDPARVLGELLSGMPFTQLSDSPLRFECKCSQQRVVASLATLGRRELTQLMASGQPVVLSCDFCRTEYSVSQDQLRGLLNES